MELRGTLSPARTLGGKIVWPGFAVKTGTTNSSAFDTGLSQIKYLALYKTTLTTTGLIQAIYRADDGFARYTYCSSYAQYVKNFDIATNKSIVVSGGSVDWARTGTTGLTENTTYHWFAVGKE